MNAKYFLPAAGLLAAFFNANATISFETLGDLSGGIIKKRCPRRERGRFGRGRLQ